MTFLYLTAALSPAILVLLVIARLDDMGSGSYATSSGATKPL